MLDQAQQFLHWIAAHPGPALWILFGVALIDALFILGAFVPASIMLFGVGALVALGTLELWETAAIAAAGALTGDALSFWLGRVYGERLFEWKPLQRYPELVNRGRRFFAEHGGKGVMLARFLGPVRSVTPAMAGAAGMPAWLFLLADGVAAYAWALAYIVPGMVFGASLGLAAEVASRLAGLLVLVFVAIGLAFWLTRMSVLLLQKRAERWLGRVLDWSRRHRRLGRFGAALTDSSQPETPALAALAVLLSVIGAAWLFVWAGSGLRPYPSRIDALVYQTLHDLQTPWGSTLAQNLSQLGNWTVYMSVAVAVLLMLLIRRRMRAAAHWVAALGFGAFISAVLHAIPILSAPAQYFHGIDPAEFGERDLVMVTVIYGFIPVLLTTRRATRYAGIYYGVAISLLLLIALGRMYLGVEWWSLTLFSLTIGALWTALLGLGFRRHRPEAVPARGFLLPVLLVLLIALGLRWSDDTAPAPRQRPASELQTMTTAEWWKLDYARLPARRLDVRGQPGPAFNLQWAGTLEQIEQSLLAAGWQPPAPLAGSNGLRWLTATTPVAELPVLPQVHAGSHQALMLRKPIDDQHQLLVRLWPSGWQLADGTPLWVGMALRQEARSYYRLFRYPLAIGSVAPELGELPSFVQKTVNLNGQPLQLLAPVAVTPIPTPIPIPNG